MQKLSYFTNIEASNHLDFSNLSACHNLDPGKDSTYNDLYLISTMNSIYQEDENYYDSNSVNDFSVSLDSTELDSIRLMVDTVLEERGWQVVVNISKDQCAPNDPILIDTSSAFTNKDTIQIIVEIKDSDSSIDYETEILVSKDIEEQVTQRLRTYVIDSVATVFFDQDSLYRGVIKSIERFRRPLPGDPLFEMRVVHPITNGNTNPIGGFFGCVRSGNSSCATSTIIGLPTSSTYTTANLTRDKVHDGFDLFAALDTDIFAMYGGVVEEKVCPHSPNTYIQSSYGNRIVLKHTPTQYGGNSTDPDIYTLYTHLNNCESISVGDSIQQGEKIGETGRTGNAANIDATTYHTHLRVHSGSYRIMQKSSISNPSIHTYSPLH